MKHLINIGMKMIDVPTGQLEAFRDHLQSKGIEIFAIALNSIEAKYSVEYMVVLDMIRELDQGGWV